jgi:hypothetical protein
LIDFGLDEFCHNWFDPIEAGLRERVREFLMFEGELSRVCENLVYLVCFVRMTVAAPSALLSRGKV